MDILKKLGITVPRGTMYPLMGTLKRKMLVTRHIEEMDFGHPWMYHVTDAGRQRLSELYNEWTKLNSRLIQLRSQKSIYQYQPLYRHPSL
ncbi:MAG: helix-turn-helix transcriptional regulator [Patescibacteria group bacterium]|nr:helix-turn-helix transcriptional regulator [Patescibacteria group bacterium]